MIVVVVVVVLVLVLVVVVVVVVVVALRMVVVVVVIVVENDIAQITDKTGNKYYNMESHSKVCSCVRTEERVMKKNVCEGGCFSFTLSVYVIASLFDVVVFGILGQLLAFFRAGSTAAWLAQLGERQSAEQEVEVSNPRAGPKFGVLKKLRRKCCLCNDICKRLDFLFFSNKDEKP